MSKLQVLAICGTLAQQSFNRQALRVAISLAQDAGAKVTELDLAQLNLPLYDTELDTASPPANVQQLRQAAAAADLLLIASPEHNYSISAALKNVLDWLPRKNGPLDGKVAAIFGASTGPFGTLRGQLQLRQILTSFNVFILPQPQVMIRTAQEVFDDQGQIKDEKLQQQLKDLVEKIEVAGPGFINFYLSKWSLP